MIKLNGKLKKILPFCILGLFWWATTYIITDALWILWQPNHHFLNLIHEVTRWQLPSLLVCGLYVFSRFSFLKRLQPIFDRRLWLTISIPVIIYGSFDWITSPYRDSSFFIGNYHWQWAAVIGYSMLFVIQSYLWHSRGFDNATSWVMSAFGCYLTSKIYELPLLLLFTQDTLPIILFNSLLYIGVFVGLKLKLSKWLLPSLACISVWYVVLLSNLPWGSPFWLTFHYFARLAPMPLFISIPLMQDGKKQ